MWPVVMLIVITTTNTELKHSSKQLWRGHELSTNRQTDSRPRQSVRQTYRQTQTQTRMNCLACNRRSCGCRATAVVVVTVCSANREDCSFYVNCLQFAFRAQDDAVRRSRDMQNDDDVKTRSFSSPQCYNSKWSRCRHIIRSHRPTIYQAVLWQSIAYTSNSKCE